MLVLVRVDPIPYDTPKPAGHTRFVCVSDTHSRTDGIQMPYGDVLLHMGDFTELGLPSEVKKFNDWLGWGGVRAKARDVLYASPITGPHSDPQSPPPPFPIDTATAALKLWRRQQFVRAIDCCLVSWSISLEIDAEERAFPDPGCLMVEHCL
ncbi:metallophosphoesterase MPPED2a isoform X2 [Lates japonicus]|uniref:Metallophosphoesterase MPPED2a isoform X2 n=1 Tax=Lates japonicus TaxID=270547 RepID=A0AAD3MGL1_LATJO|nr:metallophosphoesterase MPPED2a isoform X2 [Lates japonicus]